MPSQSGGSQFNSALDKKIFVQINEQKPEDIKKNQSEVKECTTRDYNTIEVKFCSPYQQRNYCRIAYCSNHKPPVASGEQRMVLFEADPSRKNDTAFWNHVYNDEFLQNPAVMSALRDYLQALDLTGFSSQDRSPVPITKIFKQCQYRSMSVVFSTLKEMVANGFRAAEGKIWEKQNFGTHKRCFTMLLSDFASLVHSHIKKNRIDTKATCDVTEVQSKLEEVKGIVVYTPKHRFDKYVIITSKEEVAANISELFAGTVEEEVLEFTECCSDDDETEAQNEIIETVTTPPACVESEKPSASPVLSLTAVTECPEVALVAAISDVSVSVTSKPSYKAAFLAHCANGLVYCGVETLGKNKGKLNLPGGKIELIDGGDCESTVRREFKEETGSVAVADLGERKWIERSKSFVFVSSATPPVPNYSAGTMTDLRLRTFEEVAKGECTFILKSSLKFLKPTPTYSFRPDTPPPS